jgi:hypothetical protein
MAEFIMKDIVKRNGLEDVFVIESAATSTEEIGNEVYPPAKRKLAEHNVTWSRRDSFCKDQYAVKQPEEFPTAPVSTVIRQSSPPPGADSFDHFNFDKEVEW